MTNRGISGHELGDLFSDARMWLLRNGTYFEEPLDDILQERDALQVRSCPVSYWCEFPVDMLQRVVPSAVAALAVDSTVRLDFFPSYFQLGIGDVEYKPSQLYISIGRRNNNSETVYIDGPDHKTPYSLLRELDDSTSPDEDEFSMFQRGDAGDVYSLKHEELLGLRYIVSRLDLLRRIQG